QLNFLDNFYAKGIYLKDEMIGFTLYGIDEDEQQYWIYRMMIDKKFQGKGYGKKAIQLIIDDIRAMKEDHHKTISLSYEPENEVAKYIYSKMGFKEVDGLIIEGEQVARLNF